MMNLNNPHLLSEDVEVYFILAEIGFSSSEEKEESNEIEVTTHFALICSSMHMNRKESNMTSVMNNVNLAHLVHHQGRGNKLQLPQFPPRWGLYISWNNLGDLVFKICTFLKSSSWPSSNKWQVPNIIIHPSYQLFLWLVVSTPPRPRTVWVCMYMFVQLRVIIGQHFIYLNRFIRRK